MQIAVRFGGKAGVDTSLEFVGAEVFSNDFSYKVGSFVCGNGFSGFEVSKY
jgi:hypothetical protein